MIERPQIILPDFAETCRWAHGMRVRREDGRGRPRRSGAWWRLPDGTCKRIRMAGGAGPTLDHALAGTKLASGTSISANTAFAVPVNELVVIAGCVQHSETSQSVSDSASNVYRSGAASLSAPNVAWAAEIGACIVSNALVTTPTATTLTYAASATTGAISVHAGSFTGVTSAVGYGGAVNGGTSSPATVSTSVSVAKGDLVVLLLSSTTTPGTPTGWSQVNTVTGQSAMFYLVPTSSGVVSVSSGSVGANWLAAILAFGGGARSTFLL